MDRLRVLMLGWEFPPKITGGLGVACAGLAGALRGKVDLELVLPEGDTGEPYATGDDYDGDLWRRVLDFAATVPVEPGRFDLVHAHDWLTVPAAMEVARRTGLPVVFQVHSLELDRSGQRNRIFLVERAGMRSASRVIPVSRYTAGRCERNYGISRSKLRVVPNGTGMPSLPPQRAQRPKVLFVGRVTAQKSPADFLAMAAEVARRRPEVEFVMAGAGDLLEEMRALAVSLGLEGRIRFPGFLGRGAVMAELAGASLLVLPSKSEPFGLVALEAAALGVPAVVTDHCGVAEVLPSTTVVPVGNVAAMADAVVSLLGDPAQLESRGAQAREEAGAASWDAAAQRVVEVYREVVAERPVR